MTIFRFDNFAYLTQYIVSINHHFFSWWIPGYQTNLKICKTKVKLPTDVMFVLPKNIMTVIFFHLPCPAKYPLYVYCSVLVLSLFFHRLTSKFVYKNGVKLTSIYCLLQLQWFHIREYEGCPEIIQTICLSSFNMIVLE